MESKMLAGAGKEEILLKEDYLAIEEFAIVHRALDVRAVIVESQTRIAFVSIEMTSLPEEEINEIKDRMVEAVPLEKENIWVSCTHTFSAPHLLPDFILKEPDRIAKKAEYREAIQNAVVVAITKAYERMTPVTMRVGSAFCDINTARDVELEDGWWIGENGKGLVNHEIQVLRLDNFEGKPIAVIYNYAIQSSVLDGSTLSAGGKAVSPDLAGTACDYVERKYHRPHSVALFLMGAAGDQVPVERSVSESFINGERVRTDRHEEGFQICEKLGRSLGEAVYAAAEKAQPISESYPISMERKQIKVPAKEMDRNLKNLKPVREFSYKASGETVTEVEVITIGDTAIVGVRPELNCLTATALKACSPYCNTWITTMINGASKYMADKHSYDRYTYEAQNSPFGKGAAEILVKETVQMLETMKEREVSQKIENGKYVLRSFTDIKGRTLNYNLFVPEHYNPKNTYPLVLFLHDAGICSKTDREIIQENGARIWVAKEEQQKRPCIVVVPHYPEKCAEDDYTVGWEADTTMKLLQSLMKKYSVNKNRIYGTGQSMGCMILCELNIRYPDFFGGCFLVAGQWNPETMGAVKHANLWILVSEKDFKAFPIMGDCVKTIEAAGTEVSRGSWSAKSSEAEQNRAVKDIENENHIYFTWFEGDSVIPDGETVDNPGAYHVNTWRKAYGVEAIREWLFKQYKTIDFSGKHDVMICNEDGSLQPMDQPFFEARKVAEGTWQILSDGDYSYLVEGQEQAIVIDSGYGCGNIREFCQTLTDKPVKNIANTHHHFDHTANNSYFECVYMSAETVSLATVPFPSFEGVSFPRDYQIEVVKEGDVIDLGGRSLEVFEIPDHAVGSIAFLDKKEKILFCGDELCMPMGKPLNGSVERFKGYLDKLMTRRTDIEYLMGGPGICKASLLEQLLENMNYILEGHEGEKEDSANPRKGPDHKPVDRDSIPEGVTVYNRRLPHWPEDMPAHMGKPNPDKRIMNYAGTTVIYNVNKVYE